MNEAVRDLEKSQALNDNRSVYRSSLLLEQDRAVRSANLARIYQDAGMSEVAFREAGRAVNSDYGNYSAHLFLAESLNPGSDIISRRYESAANSEYQLANLLSPANAGVLSPTLSQSEYSRLFSRNRLGLVSGTEYLSRGAWNEYGAQYGTFEKSSYSIEWGYLSDPGQHRNGDLEQLHLDLHLKQQITPKDTVSFSVGRVENNYGDVAPRYNPEQNRAVTNRETQEPNIYAGYHHEWNPGIHTLLMLSRQDDHYAFTGYDQMSPLIGRNGETPPGVVVGVIPLFMNQKLANQLEVYSAELQQIWETESHNTVVGGRFQYGDFDTKNVQWHPSHGEPFPNPPPLPADQDLRNFMRRFGIYAYHQWDLLDSLQLTAGLTYDRVTFPQNVSSGPISDQEATRDQLSPKAGIIWRPLRDTTLRFAYTRSLFGATLDQSLQIEPSQVAGFVQSYRSIIPEAIAGVNAGARFETYAFSLEQKFDSGTYLGISGEWLNSRVHRTVGAFHWNTDLEDFASVGSTKNNLDYEERSLLFTANQLIGREWSLGASYRLSQATLKSDFVEIPEGVPQLNGFQPRQRIEALLHNLTLFGVFNHRCGFFSRAEATWYGQSDIDSLAQRGDEFWQFNTFAGYRWPRRRAEVTLGILNIGDQDYRLNPINIYTDLPRERTLTAQLRLNF